MKALLAGAALAALLTAGPAWADVRNDYLTLMRDRCEQAAAATDFPGGIGPNTMRDVRDRMTWTCYGTYTRYVSYILDKTDAALMARCVAEEQRRRVPVTMNIALEAWQRVKDCAHF